jgi:glutamate 5-kinase
LKKSQKTSKKIVVKVGSSLLTGGGTSILSDNLYRIVCHIDDFLKCGHQVILVTSGAIASGLSVLGLPSKPKELALLQAAAAAGQSILMQAYSEAFDKLGRKIGQILLTRDDFNDRQRYLNARSTMNTLLKHGVIPVINENDAVSVDQIRFGDNDTLAARVAAAVEADGLLILTDIEGLYEKFDPKTKSFHHLIKEVTQITPDIDKSACGTDKKGCVGGMSTKIAAARIATSASVPLILAYGLKDELNVSFDAQTYDAFDGTRFLAAAAAAGSRKHWMAFEAVSEGKLTVDDGAKNALVRNAKSLLAPGIVKVDGRFEAGAFVEVQDMAGHIFAKGKTRFSSSELLRMVGKKNKGEVIHRYNLVIIG